MFLSAEEDECKKHSIEDLNPAFVVHSTSCFDNFDRFGNVICSFHIPVYVKCMTRCLNSSCVEILSGAGRRDVLVLYVFILCECGNLEHQFSQQ